MLSAAVMSLFRSLILTSIELQLNDNKMTFLATWKARVRASGWYGLFRANYVYTFIACC
jgi:hypothetical protein